MQYRNHVCNTEIMCAIQKSCVQCRNHVCNTEIMCAIQVWNILECSTKRGKNVHHNSVILRCSIKYVVLSMQYRICDIFKMQYKICDVSRCNTKYVMFQCAIQNIWYFKVQYKTFGNTVAIYQCAIWICSNTILCQHVYWKF